MPTVNVTLPLVIGWPSPRDVDGERPLPARRAQPSASWMQPGVVEPTGHRICPAVGVVERDDRRGADGHAARNGASVVTLPAGSVALAVTSFWPGSKSTAENVATPLAKAGVHVRVGRRAVRHLQDDAAVFGVERHRLRHGRRRLLEAAAQVRGRRQLSTGAMGSTQTVDRELLADAVGLTASATRTRSSVGVARRAVRVLDAVGQRDAGEARDEAEAGRAVVAGTTATASSRRTERGERPPLRPTSSVAVPARSVQATTSVCAPGVVAFWSRMPTGAFADRMCFDGLVNAGASETGVMT